MEQGHNLTCMHVLYRYSTQTAGECTNASDSDCWWELRSPVAGERQITADCADARVQAAVRKIDPGCWAACGPQGNNATSLCAVSCLFNTMLGNVTAGTPGMSLGSTFCGKTNVSVGS